jgi:hypothetical protein
LGLAHRLIALAAVDQRVVGTNPPSRDPVTRGAIIQALKSGQRFVEQLSDRQGADPS